jgi:pimeloyl-ACP methyl ester carboxylesterase
MRPADPRARLRRAVVTLAAGAVLAAVALNVVAYRQAWGMLHFTAGGSLTKGPAKLGLLEKVGVVLTGVRVPHPRNVRTPAALGLPFSTERFATADDVEVEAWWIPRERARGTIVLFHGYAGAKDTMLEDARAFRDLGWSCLLVDQRGCGGSSGGDTTIGYREMAEVEAAVAHAHGPLRVRGPVVLYGQSMGGVSVLHALAARRARADGAIVECVFDRMLSTVRNRFDVMGLPSFPSAELLCFWGGRQLGFDPFRHNPADYARAVTTPVLVLQGAHDPFAKLDEGRRVYDNLAGPKRFVVFPNTEHQALRRVAPATWRAEVGSFLDGAARAAAGAPTRG